jgi:hypothetical protein
MVYPGLHGFKMTAGIEKASVTSRKFSLFIAAAAGLAMLSGCAGSPSGSAGSSAIHASGTNVVGPRDTGSYPNLNIRPGQAAPQFTDDEAKAKLAALEAERKRSPAQAGGKPRQGHAQGDRRQVRYRPRPDLQIELYRAT